MAKAEQVALVVPCRARIDPGAFFLPPPSPWNKGRLIGQKPPLKLREVWTVRTRLQMAGNTREIALFNLAIDSKLRGCDLVRLMVRDLAHGSQVLARASVIQQETREAVSAWMAQARLARGSYLFPSRQHDSPRLSTRQYGRIVKRDRTLRG